MSFQCDWCGELIVSKRGLMTITVEGAYEDGGLDSLVHDSRRHFHAGEAGDEASCIRQALAHLDEPPHTASAEGTLEGPIADLERAFNEDLEEE